MQLNRYFAADPNIDFFRTGRTAIVNNILFEVCEDSDGELFGVMMEPQTDGALTWEDSEPTSPPEVGGGSGDTSHIAYLDFVGRWRLRGRRWIGFSTTYGHGGSMWSQDMGQNSEPNVEYRQLGMVVNPGDTIEGFKVQGYVNSNQVKGIDFRLFYQYGNWLGGWNNNSGTVRTTLFASDAIPTPANVQLLFDIPLGIQVPAPGYLIAACRSTNNFGGSKYFNSSGYVKIKRAA